MNFQSVLILTHGRSGSTLLQGLLNSIEGCVVRGENYNLCHGLFKSYESLQNTLAEFGKRKRSRQVTSPWFGAHLLDRARYIEDARTLIFRQLIGESNQAEGVICYGFKEIRYLPDGFPGGEEGLQSYLEFLSQLFPNPAFVVLTRHHDQVASSGWWREVDPATIRARLSVFDRTMREFSEGRNNVFFVNYEDMITRSEKIPALFAFLGAPYCEKRVNRVLEARHSYPTGGCKEKNLGNSNLRNRALKTGGIVYYLIDPVRETADGRRIRLSGVVVPHAEDITGMELILVLSGSEYLAEWGIASPKIGAYFPDRRVASYARFRVEVETWEKGTAELVLKDLQGRRNTVARLERKIHPAAVRPT